MAFYRGEEGSIKFDEAGSSASTIASTTSWSLTLEKDAIDTTLIGSASRYKSNAGGSIVGSGAATLLYTASSGDETNTFIEQVNATSDSGGSIFELYLDASGSKKISFKGVVTSTEYKANIGELEEISVNFVTNGAITIDL